MSQCNQLVHNDSSADINSNVISVKKYSLVKYKCSSELKNFGICLPGVAVCINTQSVNHDRGVKLGSTT